jgi:hypothetical protein
LSNQRDETTDRQHKADLDLGPLLRCQVHRDEWTEPGLHIREKKDEPIKSAQALARRNWRRRSRLRLQRRNAFSTDRPLTAVMINSVARMSG